MFKRILIPTDGSSLSRLAIENGVALAKAVGAKVTGLWAIRPTNEPQGNGTLMLGGHVAEDAADEFLKDFIRIAQEAGVPYDSYTITAETVHDAVVGAAESLSCDLICMGTHGRSQLGKILFGSELTSILSECKIPVLVYR